MATKIGEVYIDIDGKSVKLSDALKRAERDTRSSVQAMERTWQDHARSIQSIGNKLTVGFSAPVLAFSALSVKAAAEQEKTGQRFDAVFAGMNQAANAWAKEFSLATKIGEGTAKDLAVNVQDLLVPMGFAREEAFGLTKQAVQLALALQKWTGRPIEEASSAITSGLLGMTRPLQSFGVKIRDTEVQQHALEMGLAATTAAITEQDRAMSAIDLMYQRSAAALKAFKEAPDTLKDSLFQLGESWMDVKEAFGEPLVKPVQGLVTQLKELLDVLKNLDPQVRKFVSIGGVATSLIPPAMSTASSVILSAAGFKYLGAPLGVAGWTGVAGATLIPSLAGGMYMADQKGKALQAGIDAAIAAQAEQDLLNKQLDILGTNDEIVRPGDVPGFDTLPKETQDLIRSGKVRKAAAFNPVMRKEPEPLTDDQLSMQRDLQKQIAIERAIAGGGATAGKIQEIENQRIDRRREIEESGLSKGLQTEALQSLESEIERKRQEVYSDAREEAARREQTIQRERQTIADRIHQERMQQLAEEIWGQERLVDSIESQVEAMRGVTDAAQFHDILQGILDQQDTPYQGIDAPSRMRVSPRFTSMDYSERALWSLPRIRAEERHFQQRDYQWETPEQTLGRENKTLSALTRMTDRLERMHDLQDRRLNRLQ